MKKIKRKTLLYKTDVEYGDYTINHIQGCSHGCRFPCYAFNMAKRFGNVKTYDEWIEPKLVENSLELLDLEIPKYKDKIKSVQLCFTSDPFMKGYPEVQQMTLKIMKKLNDNSIKCTVLTKNIIPDDVANMSKINEFGITLVSLNEDFREKYEPYTSNYSERINSLKRIHEKGFYTWVSIEPFPTPNIVEQDLVLLLESVNFVDYIVFGRLHYNKKVSEFKDYKKFYNRCVEIVKNFCTQRNIKYHIKDGTFTEIK